MQQSFLDFLEWPMRRLIRHYRTARYLYDLVESLDDREAAREWIRSTPMYARLRESPMTYIDIGAREGPDPMLEPFSDILRFVMFEPDPEEAARLRQRFASERVEVIASAAGQIDGHHVIHLTRKRGNSSVLLPDGHSIGLTAIDGEGLDRYTVEARAEVAVRRLDDCLAERGLSADMLKIDTQGSEWPIIQGLGEHRPHVIVAECATTEIYKDQTTIWRIGAHLESLGYFPARLMRRHAVPSVDGSHRSSIQLYGDVVFVPDLSPTGRSLIARDPIRWFASLSIHGLADLARWQAREAGVDLVFA
jgi:FkbM family methyltransferase